MRNVRTILAGAAVATALAAAPAAAFTLSNGTTVTCVARGGAVAEKNSPAGDPTMRDRTGMTLPTGKGYVIVWNAAKLATLPPVVHDFIFYHECAHARVPTNDETQANCGGLKDMRAAGHAGPAVEDKLAAFFGAGNTYWDNTVKCADRPPTPPNPPGVPVLKPPG